MDKPIVVGREALCTHFFLALYHNGGLFHQQKGGVIFALAGKSRTEQQSNLLLLTGSLNHKVSCEAAKEKKDK